MRKSCSDWYGSSDCRVWTIRTAVIGTVNLALMSQPGIVHRHSDNTMQLYEKIEMIHSRQKEAMTMVHDTSAANSINYPEVKNKFMEALLSGSYRPAISLASGLVTREQLKGFYLHVVQPSMYEVGQLWESGEISVTREHAASAIVTRVIAVLQANFSRQQPSKGRAIVTATANEHHELGAWIVADMLELDGWEVRYLGANTPFESLTEMTVRLRPHLLAISVTMPHNVESVRSFIAGLRQQPNIEKTTILVGGMAMNFSPDLWRNIGADGYAPDFESAVAFAEKLWERLPEEKRL
ncbi:MAG: cobalamin-dependent protein [Desulfuromonadaceae bacterium]|nr:cobalamin-dependent protein [Desulfuromonadaceae bacterium]MDD2855097.1 cobalamin-dependent protein [Desulfuromonadaceae bacterium]